MLESNGAAPEHVSRVERDLVTQLAGNPSLATRMRRAKRLKVILVPVGKAIGGPGYPVALSPHVSGLYWDRPEWRDRSHRVASRLADNVTLASSFTRWRTPFAAWRSPKPSASSSTRSCDRRSVAGRQWMRSLPSTANGS